MCSWSKNSLLCSLVLISSPSLDKATRDRQINISHKRTCLLYRRSASIYLRNLSGPPGCSSKQWNRCLKWFNFRCLWCDERPVWSRWWTTSPLPSRSNGIDDQNGSNLGWRNERPVWSRWWMTSPSDRSWWEFPKKGIILSAQLWQLLGLVVGSESWEREILLLDNFEFMAEGYIRQQKSPLIPYR